MKSVSLRPLIEHIYLEDRRQATLQVATNAGVTISYAVKKCRRIRRPPKAPEKRLALGIPVVPTGKKAIGLRLLIEYYDDDSQTVTKWYKGTVIGHMRKGYLVTLDG